MLTRCRAAQITLALCCAGTPAAQIAWSNALAPALERAREEKTIVVIAITMPGERASDLLDRVTYRDSRLTTLSTHTVNLLFEVGPSGSTNPDERLVREQFLKAGPGDPVAVPHHLFVKPGESGNGELFSSVAYQLTRGQLEWAWVDALRSVRPDFEWELAEDARAPERLSYESAEQGSETEDAPTPEQIKHALKEVKKGGGRRGGWMRSMQHINVILHADDKNATKWATNTLRSLSGRWLRGILRAIGEVSPKIWSGVTIPYLEHKQDQTREEAARALEKLLAPKSLSALKKQWRREKQENVRGRLLRALAAVGPKDKAVASAIGKVLTKDKMTSVRAQAAAATSVLETPEIVKTHIETALRDRNNTVRSAAAYAIASRRDKSLLPILESALSIEKDPEAKHWMEVAVKIVGGEDLSAFKRFVKDVLGDRADRQNIADLLNRGRRGRGDGEDGDSGDDEGGSGRGGRRRGR